MTLEREGTQVRPLDSFRCFETTDLDEAREMVGQHFCSHSLDLGTASGHFQACKNRVQGKHVSLNYLRYGAEVVIKPGELTDFFLVQIPLRGTADIQNGKSRFGSDKSVASLLNPDLDTQMRWHAGCEQILVQIERDYLLSVACEVSGVGRLEKLRFDPMMDLRVPGIEAWSRQVKAVFGAVEDGVAFSCLESEHHRVLEESLVSGLVLSQPNSASCLLRRQAHDISPAVFLRAINKINERFTEPISMLEIARWAKTTPRTVQLVFKKEVGLSPMQYLKELRLGYARHLLLTNQNSLPVGEIAALSGHTHLGRFSTAYKIRFGESPRETGRCIRYS